MISECLPSCNHCLCVNCRPTWIQMWFLPGSLELKAKARAASPASQAGSSSTSVCLLWIRYTSVAGCTDESFDSWYNLPTHAWNRVPAHATKVFNTFCKYPETVLACLMILHFERIAEKLCCFANIERYSRLNHYSGWQLVDCVQCRPNSSQMMTRGRQNILESFGLGRAGVRAFVGVVWPWVVKSPGRGTGGLVGTGYIDIELLDTSSVGMELLGLRRRHNTQLRCKMFIRVTILWISARRCFTTLIGCKCYIWHLAQPWRTAHVSSQIRFCLDTSCLLWKLSYVHMYMLPADTWCQGLC